VRTASPPVPRPAPSGPSRSPLTSFRRSAAAGRAARAATPRPRPVLGEPRSATRSRIAAGRGRAGAELRDRLSDLTAGLAAGAAASSALALVVLPGVPTGVALAAGAVVSGTGGVLVLRPWSLSAVRDGASPAATRRQAATAFVAAHAVAAVPIGLAVLLAG